MSLENAVENLKEFGKELGLDGIEFDENNTCILGIDDEFSMHLTYEPNTDRLYIYSPLVDGLPKHDKDILLKLYEALLEGSMLGGQMAGGGCGVAVKEELILMHCTIDMAHALPNALRAFAPLYVETVEKWRQIVRDIMDGKPVDITALPMGPGGKEPPARNVPKPTPTGGKQPPRTKGKKGGGDQIIKI